MVNRFKNIIQIAVCFGFLIFPNASSAQLSDNFSDGNFSENPSWQGSSAQFIINELQQLQLNNTAAATSQLTVPFASSSLGNHEWQFYIKQTFAPSGSNYARVYLVSDQLNLTNPLNGYYLQFGEALSTDAVELFRQTGSTRISVCRATNGAIAAGSDLRVRVLRSNTGLWQLFIDYSGGIDFTLEASAIDASHNSSSYIGVLCVYTASNARNFFFDDFYAGPEIADTTPPTVQSVNTTSSTQLNVLFNEKLDEVSSQTLNNYSVNNDVGPPASVLLLPDQKTIQLTFLRSFPNGETSQLTVSNVKDLFNNAITSITRDFLFFEPDVAQWKDIVITEIFADPTPSVGLPDAEFIELFNRSDKIIDLRDWQISDGASHGVLPAHIFRPGDYVILTSAASTSLFTSFGTVLGVSNFPTLNNSGENISLLTNEGTSIDVVKYSTAFYRDEDKQEGGYSLELIDPENPCAEEDNWTAAEAITGGTPGNRNSTFANKPDLTGPRLISLIPISARQVNIVFNEKLQNELPELSDISISPPVPISFISLTDELKSIELILGAPLETGKQYSIEVRNIYDCNGNINDSNFNSLVFGLPEQAVSFDIVINEILFNPRPTGVDFVEVYNRSTKFINLKNWALANYQGGLISKSEIITDKDFLFAPGQFIVFTEDKDIVKGEYISAVEERIFEVKELPSLNDDEGSIAITDSTKRVIEFFNYYDSYHSVFVNDNEGVSLERISVEEKASNSANWKSASSTVGYATPGFANSNVGGLDRAANVSVNPEIFEPITGQPSFTQIHYNFAQGGFVANVKILDTQGREIKQLVNNATLGTEGFFRWDGDTNDGSKARMGYYIVWMEVFNEKGDVETFRKRVVVSSRDR